MRVNKTAGMLFGYSFIVLFLLIGMSKSFAQQHSAKLLALVGQKCIMTLKSREVVQGTLWDYGEDFVAMKVKKGPLFSTTEKFGISEVKYIDDMYGNRIDFTTEEPAKSQTATSPTTIFFSTDDTEVTQSAEEQRPQPVTRPVERENRSEENVPTLQTLDKEETEATKQAEAKRQATVKPQTTPVGTAQVRQETRSETQPVAQARNTRKTSQTNSQKTVKRQEPVKQEVAQQATKVAKVKEEAASISDETDQTATAAGPSDGDAQKVATAPGPRSLAGTRSMRILRYQTVILFCVLFLVALVMIVSKVAGMKGSAYGKHSLFPSKLVKMNGHFGVIDQGFEDGVKMDDIIRLYRKTGQKIQYRGKVQVKKVAENYAAVEILDKVSGAPLKVGDVGFRERNFIFNFFKRSRIITSAGLYSLGKGLVYTAQNLEVKEIEPTIEIGTDQDEKTTAAQKQSTRKVVEKSKKAAPKKNGAGKDAGQKEVGFGIN